MFYKYKVNWYNSYDDSEPIDTGLVCGKTYGEAADKVVEEYGADSVISISLKEICIEGEHCLCKEEIDYTFKEE